LLSPGRAGKSKKGRERRKGSGEGTGRRGEREKGKVERATGRERERKRGREGERERGREGARRVPVSDAAVDVILRIEDELP